MGWDRSNLLGWDRKGKGKGVGKGVGKGMDCRQREERQNIVLLSREDVAAVRH